MKRTAIAVSMCCGLVPSAAAALDWSLKTGQIQTIELSDNQFLRSSPAASIGSTSTLTANAEAKTSTSKFDLDGAGTYRKYWGPGVEGGASEFLTYNIKGRYELSEKAKSDREYVEANWSEQSTALALLNDLGVNTSARGFLGRLTATGGLDRSLTARDNLSLIATSTRASYEPSSGGTAYTDTLVRSIWRHSLSSISAVSVTSEHELLNYDNANKSQVAISRNQLGTDLTLSPLLSVRGNIGAAYLRASGITSTLALSGGGSTSSSIDWIGDAVITYRMLRDTTLSLSASQSIAPSVVGSLFKRDIVSANLTHTVNNHSTLALTVNGTRSISTTSTDYVSASATYSYRFLRDWSAQLTYRYQHRFASTGGTTIIDPITGTQTVGGTGPASSNTIMLVLSHNYTILPRGN